jgi:hypothetical protein
MSRGCGFSLFSVLKSWLLKEFLFLGRISVTYSEVIAFYTWAKASLEAGGFYQAGKAMSRP